MQQQAVDLEDRRTVVIAPSKEVYREALREEGIPPHDAIYARTERKLQGLSHRRIKILLAEGAETTPAYRSSAHQILLLLECPQRRV